MVISAENWPAGLDRDKYYKRMCVYTVQMAFVDLKHWRMIGEMKREKYAEDRRAYRLQHPNRPYGSTDEGGAIQQSPDTGTEGAGGA